MEDRPTDGSSRPRRSLLVVLLDAVLGLVTAVQTGNLPGSRRGTGRRPGRAGIVWLVVGVVGAAVGTGIVVNAVLRTPESLTDLPPALGPASTSGAAAPGFTPSPSSASPVASATTTVTPRSGKGVTSSVPASRSTTAGGARLTADYAAADGSGLLGYHATVTITGQGPGAATGWRLTLTLPRPTLQVAAVDGATAEQDGSVWTFTPTDATRRVAAGASVVIAFEVRGATLVDAAPTACRIDSSQCAGIAG